MCGVAPAPLDEEAEKFAEALLALSEKPAISPAAAQGDGEPDDGRFYCPFPGCKRSFAELWRLKVHYRAPPNVRGSGKERGHGMRLDHCPKCGAVLKIGGHHVRCSAREAARQQQQLAKKKKRSMKADKALALGLEAEAAVRDTPPRSHKRAQPEHSSETELAAMWMAQQQHQQQQPAAALPQHHPQQAEHELFQQHAAAGGALPGAAYGAAASAYDLLFQQQYNQSHPLSSAHWLQQQCTQDQHAELQYEREQYQQQQQQDDQQPDLLAQPDALPAATQQMWRLQQLLARVDEHLGYYESEHAPSLTHQDVPANSAAHDAQGYHMQDYQFLPAFQQQQQQEQQCVADGVAMPDSGQGQLNSYLLQQLQQLVRSQQQEQQQQLVEGTGAESYGNTHNGGCSVGPAAGGELAATSSDSSTSGGRGRESSGSASSVDASRVSSLAADMQLVADSMLAAQQQQQQQQVHLQQSELGHVDPAQQLLEHLQKMQAQQAAAEAVQPWHGTAAAREQQLVAHQSSATAAEEAVVLPGTAGWAGGSAAVVETAESPAAVAGGVGGDGSQLAGVVQVLLQQALTALVAAHAAPAAATPMPAAPHAAPDESELLALLKQTLGQQ